MTKENKKIIPKLSLEPNPEQWKVWVEECRRQYSERLRKEGGIV